MGCGEGNLPESVGNLWDGVGTRTS